MKHDLIYRSSNNLTTDLYCSSGKTGAVQLCIQKLMYQTTSNQLYSCTAQISLYDIAPQEPAM